MEQSVNLAGSGLLVKATFSNGCVNREQMREDQNEQTNLTLLDYDSNRTAYAILKRTTQAKKRNATRRSFSINYQ
jgi:hypothetical protein